MPVASSSVRSIPMRPFHLEDSSGRPFLALMIRTCPVFGLLNPGCPRVVSRTICALHLIFAVRQEGIGR